MRFTYYYAATIFLISTVWAVPVDIDLHARKSQLSSLFQFPNLPHFVLKSHLPQIKLAGSTGKPPGKSTQGKDGAGSKFIVTFWAAEEYQELQTAGFSEWRGIDIHDEPCSDEQKAQLKQSIETLLIKATSAPNGLRVKSSRPTFDFRGTCQAQWFPVYNLFNFEVEDGEGGKCEDEKCYGVVFLKTKNGILDDINGRNNGGQEFYDSTESVDREAFESRHATLRTS